jgi:surface polysaccharide O-acyltransferase-like enzyme
MIKINGDVIIGFWSGIAVITLMSIARTVLHQTLYQYDWYILALSIIVLIVALILRNRSTKH